MDVKLMTSREYMEDKGYIKKGNMTVVLGMNMTLQMMDEYADYVLGVYHAYLKDHDKVSAEDVLKREMGYSSLNPNMQKLIIAMMEKYHLINSIPNQK
jgi:hypothetical protein